MPVKEVHLSIGGENRRTPSTFERSNPLTGSPVTRASAATPADAVAAVEAAQAAFPAWSALGPNARRAALLKAADALDAKAAEFVDAMMDEIGATEGWARFNLMLSSSMMREAASLTTQISGEIIPSDRPGCLSMAVREPAGVVLSIAPWNAPIILATRAIAVPLACGNTVVLKASELCPRAQGLIVEALVGAGLGGGIVNLVTNAPQDAADVVGAMIDHPAVRRINFTGSTSVGRIIATRCAQNLKPALLELGGKAPLIVLEDADLDEAVSAAAFGAFMNQGQVCMSTERIIVVDAIADAFVEKFKAKAAGMAAGDPREAKTPLGAVIDLKTVGHVKELVEEAVSKGAVLVNSGEADGVLMPAHVVHKVTPEMRLFREESFGPVVGIVPARDEAHAIALANDSEYGLSAAVFTRDIPRGLKVARQIKSGVCHINGPTLDDEAQMPFGGTKASGYGKFGGKAGIDSFTELRWITIAGEPGHFPI